MSAPRKRHLPRAWHATASYIVPVTLLIAWELVVRLGWVDPFLLPAPSAILATFFANAGELLLYGFNTFRQAATGFAIGDLRGAFVVEWPPERERAR